MSEPSSNAASFDIRIIDLHWVNKTDDPTDLCVHGHVFLKIGNEIVADENNLEVTLSSSALYLLRTLSRNYTKGDFASQLLPCCGFFFMFDKVNETVEICGCSSGIDWTIEHIDENFVKHTSEGGQEAIIGKSEYVKMVFAFADKIEAFYNASSPKQIPDDEYERLGYLTFWREWRRLRNL